MNSTHESDFLAKLSCVTKQCCRVVAAWFSWLCPAALWPNQTDNNLEFENYYKTFVPPQSHFKLTLT